MVISNKKVLSKVIYFSLLFLSLFLIYLYLSLNESNLDNTSDNTLDNTSSVNLFSLCVNLSGSELDNCILSNSNCSTDACYFKKSRATLNLNLCSNIKSEDLRLSCRSVVNHDLLFINAVSDNNVSICNQLQSNETIDACKNNFYYVASVNRDNKSLCNYISVEGIKNDCLSK